MTTLTSILQHVKECKERAERAEKGPWYVVEKPWRDDNCPPWVISGSYDPHLGQLVCDVPIEDVPHEDEAFAWAEMNMQFIASARTDIPRLVQAVEVLARALRECSKFLHDEYNCHGIHIEVEGDIVGAVLSQNSDYWIEQAAKEQEGNEA